MDILYEDNHLLVVNKPAGWVVQGATSGQKSLLDWGRNYIGEKYSKPGNVFLGVVSRIDASVTGVVPFARTSKAASRLSEQFRSRSIVKKYWALVEGRVPEEASSLEHWLLRRESDLTTRVVSPNTSEAKKAILKYKRITSVDNSDLLEIELVTGRKHQIRAQLQALGYPILGDHLYGSTRRFADGIALHCRQLQFQHPTIDKTMVLTARLPDSWPKQLTKLTGLPGESSPSE
jgi:23S rRNA pseudouridine1911/1915/1917 synthase